MHQRLFFWLSLLILKQRWFAPKEIRFVKGWINVSFAKHLFKGNLLNSFFHLQFKVYNTIYESYYIFFMKCIMVQNSNFFPIHLPDRPFQNFCFTFLNYIKSVGSLAMRFWNSKSVGRETNAVLGLLYIYIYIFFSLWIFSSTPIEHLMVYETISLLIHTFLN